MPNFLYPISSFDYHFECVSEKGAKNPKYKCLCRRRLDDDTTVIIRLEDLLGAQVIIKRGRKVGSLNVGGSKWLGKGLVSEWESVNQ